MRSENAVLQRDKAALIEAKALTLKALAAETERRKRAEAAGELLCQRLAEIEPDPSLRFAA